MSCPLAGDNGMTECQWRENIFPAFQKTTKSAWVLRVSLKWRKGLKNTSKSLSRNKLNTLVKAGSKLEYRPNMW